MHTFREFLSLSVVGKFTLHPDRISIRRICNGAVDGTRAAAFYSVEALAGSGALPVKRDIYASDASSDGSCLGVAFTLDALEKLCYEFFLVAVYAGVDGVNYGLVEELEASLGGPCVFYGLELDAGLASLLTGNHEIVEW